MRSISILARAVTAAGILACTACVTVAPRPDADASPLFYALTGEIALSRHQPRVAALEYAAAAEAAAADAALLRRAAEVTTECLQPSLTAAVATRWIGLEPGSVEAHRAAARAALNLGKIDESAVHYRMVLTASPLGTDAEFAALETELASTGNVYGARQLADRLATTLPASTAALRLQADTAMRADDPAAAVRSFTAALAATDAAATGDAAATARPARQEMTQALWRARILSGDADEPLAQAQAVLQGEETAAHRLDYALLLIAGQQNSAARAELNLLTRDADASPVALRLLGLMDFQQGKLDDAGVRFAELVTTGKFLDDALYYLGLIAERHKDLERALRLYAQVQNGDSAVPAMLRAAAILRAHGAAPAAEELLDRLVEDEPSRAPEILSSRARIYSDAGDLPQASALLGQALLEYPDSVELRYAVASVHEEQGRVDLSLRELQALARLRPDDPAALNAYGYTLADHHRQLGAARKLIERAFAFAPKNDAILDSFGWVLFRQGHAEEALPYLNAAYADDRGGDIAAHLGEVLWQLGRRTDAARIWSDGSQADADNALIRSTRLRLHAAN